MLRQTELMQVSDVRGIISHLVREEPVSEKVSLEKVGAESKTRPKYLSTIPGEDQPGYGGAMKAIVGAAARRGTFRGLSPSIYTEQRYKVQAIVGIAKNGKKGVSSGNRN